MKSLKFILISSLLISQLCFGQSNNINSEDSVIFKTIASLTGHFLIQKPLKNYRLSSIDTMELKEDYTDKEFAELKIKFPFLRESLILDKQTIDTSQWTFSCFPDKIIVDELASEIDYKELIVNHNLEPNKQFKDTVWKFNNDRCFRRRIVTRISQPIFNIQKTIAVIEIQKNDICGEGRTDMTYVFYKQDNMWKICDALSRGEAVKY